MAVAKTELSVVRKAYRDWIQEDVIYTKDFFGANLRKEKVGVHYFFHYFSVHYFSITSLITSLR